MDMPIPNKAVLARKARVVERLQEVLPQEYGFWANVNPEVPHRRWSQATERDITNNEMIPTPRSKPSSTT